MARAECRSWPVRARNAAHPRVASPRMRASRTARTPLAQFLEVSAWWQGSAARTRPSRAAAGAWPVADKARRFRKRYLEPRPLSSPNESADRLHAIAQGRDDVPVHQYLDHGRAA